MTAAQLEPATTYRPPGMTPAQYVTAVAGLVDGGPRVSARLAVLVLHAIADRADWAAWTWGAHSYRSAEGIAASIGYSDRAVRYAYKVLVAGGWLHIEDRPGRTNTFTVLAPVEPPATPPKPMWTRGGRRVHNHLRSVDNPVENAPASPPAARSPIAGGAATVAADLGALPKEPPPEGPPVARKGNEDGADAPAQAAPRARPAPPDEPTSPAASPAGPGSEPHRPMRGDDRVPDVPPGHPLDGPTSLRATVRRAGWGDPPSGWTRGATTGQPRRRDTRRRTTSCPTCDAPPGEACRGRGGRPRRSNHEARGA